MVVGVLAAHPLTDVRVQVLDHGFRRHFGVFLQGKDVCMLFLTRPQARCSISRSAGPMLSDGIGFASFFCWRFPIPVTTAAARSVLGKLLTLDRA